ncbi:MAG TPA: hypothetical protein PKA59_02005 [Chakrabartia sp.]|jgi:hypothetical protein|nr:hypothetical protein [Chakrabartia sp.]
MKSLIALTALCASVSASAAEVSFIACPIYRDTDNGRKSGCWLAEDPATGIRYDITQSAAKPDWNFAALVEGRTSDKPGDPCGGVVVEPARVSVLEDTPCTRHIIPAEGFPGRKFVLPFRNVDPLSKPRPKPQPPFTNRTFRLFFDWNGNFLSYQRDDYLLDKAIEWIRGVPVKRLTITGFGAYDPVTVSGRAMSEEKGISDARATQMAEAFYRLGIPKAKIVAKDGGDGGVVDDDGSDGMKQQSRRRVDVFVELEP